MTLWVLTTDGIRDFENNEIQTPFEDRLVHHGQYGNGKAAVIVDRKQIWIYDGKWKHEAKSDIKLNCLLWTPQGLLVGTDKARLAWVGDKRLEFIELFDEVDNRKSWTTPGGGNPDVRSLSLDQNGTIYANIHVGWIVRSTDGGVTWESCTDGLAKDVHQVATHPREEGVVFAATAMGFHVSQDSGLSFEKRWDKSQTYQRSVQAFAGQESVLVSVSNGPHSGSAKIYRSTDRGSNWEQITDLPADIGKNINTYQISTHNTGIGYVITENQDIYKTTDYGKSWDRVSAGFTKAYQIVELVD